MSINVLLVDDDDLVRNSLKTILDINEEFNVVGLCRNGDEAYKKVISDPGIDVILMDIQMPVCNGVLATKNILGIRPDVKIIVLTTFDDDDYIIEALKCGAKGYLLKNITADKITDAVKIVKSGSLLVHPEIASKLPRVLTNEKKISFEKYNLTEVEVEIVRLISKGFTNKEIAEKLFLGEGTIKNKTSEILNKLGLRDRTQIAIFYLNNGKVS
ncbi:MAG: response regulator transcription factor [Clostridia bacterium]|nr:response regulator transcription factor [Clostridia bacterium]